MIRADKLISATDTIVGTWERISGQEYTLNCNGDIVNWIDIKAWYIVPAADIPKLKKENKILYYNKTLDLYLLGSEQE